MGSVQSILVPLDGSRFAEAALPYAVALARDGRPRLRLVLVHSDPPGAGAHSRALAEGTQLRRLELEYLEATASRLASELTGRIEILHLEGNPGPVLEEEVSRGADDLVLMATHGRGALSRFWLGSVAEYLIRHLAAPILLIRPEDSAEPAPEGRVSFRRILVPLDSSVRSELILDPTLRLATIAGTSPSIILLTAVEPILGAGEIGLPVAVPLDPGLMQERCRGAELRLQAVAERMRSEAVTVVMKVESAARPAQAILEAAEQESVDLIAMTTHGEGGLRRILLGSVADKVIRGSSVPVLVLRPAEADASRKEKAA